MSEYILILILVSINFWGFRIYFIVNKGFTLLGNLKSHELVESKILPVDLVTKLINDANTNSPQKIVRK